MSKTVGISDEIHAHIKQKAKFEGRSMKDIASTELLAAFDKLYEQNTYGSGTWG